MMRRYRRPVCLSLRYRSIPSSARSAGLFFQLQRIKLRLKNDLILGGKVNAVR